MLEAHELSLPIRSIEWRPLRVSISGDRGDHHEQVPDDPGRSLENGEKVPEGPELQPDQNQAFLQSW